MRTKALSCLFLLVAFIVQPLSATAMETDQYNLPTVQLGDIGDEVSEYVENSLFYAVAKINGDIAHHQACITVSDIKETGCVSADSEQKELNYLRSNDAVAREVYRLLGEGNLFVSPIGAWMNSHKFVAEPSRYKTGYFESIYVAAPQDYATISPTVRLFGAEFGTDKLDHFFQQGYKYYKIAKEAKAQGATADQADAKAVKWGQKTERTYFGLLVSGVYSNADLYANYAGLKFYQGLTSESEVNGKIRLAPLSLQNGIWIVDVSGLRENLLKPYLTDHLNEALNPSGYALTIYGSVRTAVQNYGCPEWQQKYPAATAVGIANRTKDLELWNGDDYGFTLNKRMISLADLCFSKN
jgi:hypothetical protein